MKMKRDNTRQMVRKVPGPVTLAIITTMAAVVIVERNKISYAGWHLTYGHLG